MKELLKSIDRAVKQELNDANTQHPMFHSPHEGLGVIDEEITETLHEIVLLAKHFDIFKDCVFDDSFLESHPDFTSVDLMAADAQHLAAEAVQVAAMCQKFIDSFKLYPVMIGKHAKNSCSYIWRVPEGLQVNVGDLCKVGTKYGDNYAKAERIEQWTVKDIATVTQEVKAAYSMKE